MKKPIMHLLTGCLLIGGWSCSKSAFLDKSPSTQLVLPNTLSTLQALLDKDEIMNISPSLGELSADNFYLSTGSWQGLDPVEHNAYIWAKEIYGGVTGNPDWDLPYQQVFTANTVLAGIATLSPARDSLAKAAEIRGAAYFFRAYAFHQLAQVFCRDYYATATNTDPGIPLRLSPAVEPHSVRATVEQTYQQILADLDSARSMLSPDLPVINRNRPSLPALQAFRARVHLSMGQYEQARLYADSCLLLYNTLIDYNTLDTNVINNFKNTNDETLFQGKFRVSMSVLLGYGSPAIIDSSLYKSYSSDDLRRSVFFARNSSGITTKFTYSGSVYPFSGLAIDEVYLIRSESAARTGDKDAAMADLNLLLRKRYRHGRFAGLQAVDASSALALVLQERRKELFMRGIRWSDLRRFNREGVGVRLQRLIDGFRYTLEPGDDRYILPIPPDVLSFNPGMQQNPR